ncbi:Imm50 family immunity protein [Paractinoplanes brasiliensis]|uniref:Immunity protein 50 of polymorphic toxin system n=1 Tax=Paractinoplanes brasiliensis TaxID=52695 RepID=A0A4R6JWD7_9ACTN|nr:Imm50 family immunity protein [Actinoplanes brasiliensis]TDO40597.1 immunity protein 50 of polymorphic toxin system [Actinoplanes brasiliensis]GID25666.1 hypothetical protein Abr02nite_06490 [Actinoplanes brasiliensis]
MAGWTQALGNPEGILTVYGGDVPELVAVSVHELTIERDGPSLTVTFDLPSYPADPPAKWVRGRFNVVQVRLRLFGLTDLEVSGFSTDPVVDIGLTAGDPVHLAIRSTELTVTASAAFADLAGFSAYQRSDTR